MWCKTQVSHHTVLTANGIGKASFPLDHRKSYRPCLSLIYIMCCRFRKCSLEDQFPESIPGVASGVLLQLQSCSGCPTSAPSHSQGRAAGRCILSCRGI
jgi:hypothetical protein